MEITKIEESKKRPGIYNIFADGEFLCSAHKDIVVELRLKVGVEFDPESTKEIMDKLQYKKALDNAFNILARVSKTELEMKKKLKEKDYSEEIINQVMEKLEELGYINDEAFAELWIRSNSSKPGMNRRTMFNKLRLKGIDRDLIESKLSEDSIDEYSSAMVLAQKKYKNIKGEIREKRRKLYGYLLNKGFTSDICNKVLNELNSDDISDL